MTVFRGDDFPSGYDPHGQPSLESPNDLYFGPYCLESLKRLFYEQHFSIGQAKSTSIFGTGLKQPTSLRRATGSGANSTCRSDGGWDTVAQQATTMHRWISLLHLSE